MEVREGDYPLSSENKVAGVTLLAGVSKVPRIKELQRVAIEAQDNIEEIRQQSDENLEDLLHQDTEDLEPLF